MHSIVFEGDTYVKSLEERLVLDSLWIEPGAVRELLETGPPVFPGFSTLDADLRGAARIFHLVTEGLGNQVAERTSLLRGKRLCLSEERIGQIEGRLHCEQYLQLRESLSSPASRKIP